MKSDNGFHKLLVHKGFSHKKVPNRLCWLTAKAEVLLADGGGIG